MRFRNDADNNIEKWDPERGDQIPYRGAVNHLPNQKMPVHEPEADPGLVEKAYGEDAENVKEQKLVDYDTPKEKPPYVTPIPVDVYNLPNSHEFKSSTYREITVGQTPLRIVGRDKSRTKVVLNNGSAETTAVFIGDNPGIIAASGNCFGIRTSNFLELATQEEIYVVSETDEAVVSVLQEFVQRT